MATPQNQSLQLRSMVFHDLESVQKTLTDFMGKAHILTPFCRSQIPLIPAGWDVHTHLYTISTKSIQVGDKTVFPDEEVYRVPGSSKLALSKIGLWRLEQLAGVTWVNPETEESTIRRMETGDPLLVSYSAVGYMRDIDGQVRCQSDGYTYDLRDGSPQAIAYTDKQLPKARQNIAQVALTKAKLRVLRGLLGIKASYEPDELKKPFLVLRLAFNLDAIDPAIKNKLITIMVAKQMGIEKELFQVMKPESSAVLQLDAAMNPKLPDALPENASSFANPENTPPDSFSESDSAYPGPTKEDEDSNQVYWIARTARIDRITALYLSKKGASREKLSPDKPSLPNLNDDELAAIEDALSKLPDIQNLI